MAIRLTDRQAVAAASAQPFTNIVSAPGSGKTTVSAERFGFVTYEPTLDARGVLGLSFTRAAVGELRSRISGRWGQGSLGLPNLVTTFDDLHVRVLHHLLAVGIVNWPGGHLELEVLDEYRGMNGFRFREPGSWKRIAACRPSGSIFSDGHQVTRNEYGFGAKAHHQTALAAGYCSHEDVRWVLRSAIQGVDGAKEEIRAWLTTNFRHIVIDEIYDADALDLWTVRAAGRAGTHLTAVGDPWQALYRWRGATPEKVQMLLESLPFCEFDQPESFRFRGEQMPALARELRAGASVVLPGGLSVDVDVALARTWGQLWDVGDNVLPLAFRTIGNATDAMLNLLLDEVTRRKLGREAFGTQAACVYLRLDPAAVSRIQSAILGPVLQALADGVSTAAVLSMLRDAAVSMGVQRRPSKLQKKGDAIRQAELSALRLRLAQNDLIPGLTVHQAKGREWESVGYAMSPKDALLLAGGLEPLVEDHCVIYVALTRARLACVALNSADELDI